MVIDAKEAGLDPEAILAALGVTAVESVTPVRGGMDTAIWRVESGGKAYALRVFRTEQAPVARREVIAMRAAGEAGIPVPEVYAAGAWQERPALLIGWCAGEPMLHALLARPARGWKVCGMLGQMQARIHTVTAPEALRGEAHDWITAAGLEEPALQARLRALSLRSNVLLHLDYHPMNVLTDGEKVTAVIDWADVRAGDPRADLARTLTLLRLSPAPEADDTLKLKAMRWLVAAGWRRGYRQAGGPLGDLTLFYAWAGARMLRGYREVIGRPGVWVQPHHLERIRLWTETWKRRAGIED